MAPRVMVGIVALACGSICGMMGTLANFEMVDAVNEKLPKDEQFEVLGWYFSKTQRLHREYRRLYPDGRLLQRVRLLSALMAVCLLICIWGLGLLAK